MNILVTGANGQLGNEMRIVAKNSADNYIFTDVAELDITNAEAVEKMVMDNDVKVIVNCAAYTNVDKAEDDSEFAEILNAKAAENLAVAMKKNDGLLVHVSTDYVFGGDPYNTPCTEDRKGTPTGVYGLTKLHGEQAVTASGCKYVILRTAWLYSEFGKNFLKTMLSLTASKPEIRVVFDQTGTPTYAAGLASAIMNIMKDYASAGLGRADYPRSGIYNYSDEGVCSWFDFARAVGVFSGHSSCRVLPCHSDEYPSKVKRPAYSVLDKTRIKEVFGIEVPYWTDGVKKCCGL